MKNIKIGDDYMIPPQRSAEACQKKNEDIEIQYNKMRKSKKAQVFEFNWLLVTIIGAVILFIAIFFAARLINSKNYETSAELVPSFDILLNPFSSIGTMSKTLSLQNNVVAEITCEQTSDFMLGKQMIKVKSQGAFGRWSDFTEFPYYIYDKYVFADVLEGRNFYVFGKTLEMPFRISELIYMLSGEYCFIDAPENIADEITDLEIDAIKLSAEECSEESKKVCFGQGVCDINVHCDDSECISGYVEKQENGATNTVYFVTNSLMYAGIFASSKNYNCNFARLSERISHLNSIYSDKADKLKMRGCILGETANLISHLSSEAKTFSRNTDTSKLQLYVTANDIKNANMAADCALF